MDDFTKVLVPVLLPPKRGRPALGQIAMTDREKKYKYRQEKREKRLRQIAVLDMETEPFSDANAREGMPVLPFCAELYSDQFGSIVVWEEDFDVFIEKLTIQIEALPDKYTIYAHNGGKFDWMFLVRKLRGTVRFKGRSIMAAKIGQHELRDSLHILPEKLAAWKKDKFDYSKLLKQHRRKFRADILEYLHNDCIYLFEFIKGFVKEFGLKLSIGQAAFTALKSHYKIAPIKEKMDSALRTYFLGGRVECIAGRGLFESYRWQKPYKLFDVNSMYPFVMATRAHPVSPEYIWRRGDPGPDTVFLDLSCKSYGVMFSRLDTGEIVTDDCEGRFHTTIWEFETALKYGLIENVKIHWCIDNMQRTDFSKFIVPMYDRRQETKDILKRCRDEGDEVSEHYESTKRENIFLKYLLNNAYGKCAQNPRKYKEYYYTDHGEKPPHEWFDFMEDADDEIRHAFGMPVERCAEFDVWARPSPGSRFNNVGTAASITGAARAVLLEAIQNAVDPIYCDTDSLICRDLNGVEIDEIKLGAWKIEETFDNVIITGKKTYCCEITGKNDGQENRLKVRSKGVDLRVRPVDQWGLTKSEATENEWRSANAATWNRYLSILDEQIISIVNQAPTFNKLGDQHYLTRRIKATAPLKSRGITNANRTSRVQNSGRKLSAIR